MTASLAERIRAVAVTLRPAVINEATNELYALADRVDRIERALDEIVADAMESANMQQQPRATPAPASGARRGNGTRRARDATAPYLVLVKT